MQSWLEANGRKRTNDVDTWYVHLSNELLPIIEQCPLFPKASDFQHAQVAIVLSLYMQDTIAQKGGWTVFKKAYRKLYDKELPFYTTGKEYVEDEVNQEDISFVLWTQLARPAKQKPDDYTLQDPYENDLLYTAQTIYDVLNRLFEEAPINDTPSPNTWLMNIESLAIPTTPLPDSQINIETDNNVTRCLAYSKGEPLLFFRTYAELSTFFVHVLGWENRPEDLLPELKRHKDFIIYANTKGMLIGHDVASYFHVPHNTLYSPEETKRTGHRLFCEPGACPFDLLKYGIQKGYLEDITLPFVNGRKILHDNRDFLMRYYLEEYYEGK